MAEKKGPREVAEILRRELSSKTALSKIDEDFIEGIKKYIDEIEEKIKKAEEIKNPLIEKEIDRMKAELDNIKRMVEKIVKERCRKIVFLALAYSESDPSLAPVENLLPEERQLFEELATKIYNTRKILLEKMLGEEKSIKKDRVLVRVLENIEEFIWEDGSVYGPFSKEDIVKLPEGVARMLKERGKVEVIS